MLCPADYIRGRGRDQNPSISSLYNKSFLLCHHFPIQYKKTKKHSPTSSISVTYSIHTIFQQQCNLTLLAHSSIFLQPLQFCSPHPPVPTDPPQIPTQTNKCSASPALDSHITSIIILHHFLSSNNPAEPVFSLNSSLKTY